MKEMKMIPSKAFEARANLQSKLDTAKEVYATMLAVLKSENLTVDDLTEEQKEHMEVLSELIRGTEELLNRFATVN